MNPLEYLKVAEENLASAECVCNGEAHRNGCPEYNAIKNMGRARSRARDYVLSHLPLFGFDRAARRPK